MKRIFTLLLALLAITTLWAYDFQSGDLYYNITNDTIAPYTVGVARSIDKPLLGGNYPNIISAIIPETITYDGTTYSVTSIEDGTFAYCESLTSITISNNVTSIGYRAFCGCSSLTSVIIPDNMKSIGEGAFIYCDSLSSITIPNSVTSIGYEAFSSCSSLTSIVVKNGNAYYDSRNNCNAIIETATNTLIAGCQNTIIPNSVTSIGDEAFYYCSKLTSITIPNNVTSIGDWAFSGCSGLTSITIPNSVTSIENYTFYGCYSLTSVTLGNSVTSIGYAAFAYCSGLTSVTSLAEVPPTLGTDVFYKVSNNIPVYVRCGTVSAYQSAEGWKDFTNIQCMPEDESAVDNVHSQSTNCQKILRDGHLLIIRDGVEYNAMGQEIR